MNALAIATKPTPAEMLGALRSFDRIMRVMSDSSVYEAVWLELPPSMLTVWTVARDVIGRAGQ